MSARPITTSTNPVPRNAMAPRGAAKFTFVFISFRGSAALQCGKAEPYRNMDVLDLRLRLRAVIDRTLLENQSKALYHAKHKDKKEKA
jgi:hypothetical protein